jgi:GNAT superfamily N-acetyltransferase
MTSDFLIELRPVNESDLPFLQQVYASTRNEELSLTNWDEAQKTAFIAMQFEAQHRYYHENYIGADWQVILVDGQPAGRLYLHPRPNEIRVMDITLLPQFRGRGIGTCLLGDVLAEGARSNRKITIHVEKYNPALWLYQKLGFQVIEDKGVYLFLGWYPEWYPQNANQDRRRAETNE